MMAQQLTSGMLVVLTTASLANGEDWPQWRGPQRNGISAETGLLGEWPAEGPKLVWQQNDIGSGYSTPAVVGQRLYLISNEGDNDEFVQSHAVADGKRLWRTRLGKVGPNDGPQYPGSRSTPTVDGDRLYALGSDGDLACVETASGKVVWKKNLREEFGGSPGRWAYSESPLVDGQRLICTPGGSEATLVALNKQDGTVVWKSAVPGGDKAAYASPMIVETGGARQIVQFVQGGLVGVDAQTGKFLWRYDKTAEGSPANIPTPVVHEGTVYSASGRGGAGLVRIRANGDSFEAVEVYFTPRLPTAIGGSVLVGDYLYGTNSQGLICADFAQGEVKWQDRSIGTASLCYADERLYLHGENGDVALVEATPQAYRQRGKFSLPGQPDRGRSKAWAYPVVANGKLYFRDLNVLWCYDIRPDAK
jgi:outer membrane protein assembly factor BamB